MLVGIIGAKTCGKSTAAAHLVHAHSFHRVGMANGLKDMLAVIGLTHDQLYGDQKEVPCALLCGKTPRWAMQSLGTDWGRNLIGEDIWLNAAITKITALLQAGEHVVVDDARFHGEVDAIHTMGGIVLKVRRDVAESVPDTHESEAFWRTLPYDKEIDNNGDMDTFIAAVERELFE